MKISIAKEAFNRKLSFLTSKLNTEHRKKFVRCYVWSIALNSLDIWTLIILGREYLESFETWCWRRMEKIKWSEKVTNELLEGIGEKRAPLNNNLRRKKPHDIIERQMMKVEGVERRRITQLFDDLRNRRRY